MNEVVLYAFVIFFSSCNISVEGLGDLTKSIICGGNTSPSAVFDHRLPCLRPPGVASCSASQGSASQTSFSQVL